MKPRYWPEIKYRDKRGRGEGNFNVSLKRETEISWGISIKTWQLTDVRNKMKALMSFYTKSNKVGFWRCWFERTVLHSGFKSEGQLKIKRAKQTGEGRTIKSGNKTNELYLAILPNKFSPAEARYRFGSSVSQYRCFAAEGADKEICLKFSDYRNPKKHNV